MPQATPTLAAEASRNRFGTRTAFLVSQVFEALLYAVMVLASDRVPTALWGVFAIGVVACHITFTVLRMADAEMHWAWALVMFIPMFGFVPYFWLFIWPRGYGAHKQKDRPQRITYNIASACVIAGCLALALSLVFDGKRLNQASPPTDSAEPAPVPTDDAFNRAVEESTARALAKYPVLADAESPAHQNFIQFIKDYRSSDQAHVFTSSLWPEVLAERFMRAQRE